MKPHIYKLMRRTSFDQIRVYYLEGTKADLFALIGYIYSCLTEGTERVDYKTIPAFEPQAPNMIRRLAHSEDFNLYYYEDASCWTDEPDCDYCKYHDVMLTQEPWSPSMTNKERRNQINDRPKEQTIQHEGN